MPAGLSTPGAPTTRSPCSGAAASPTPPGLCQDHTYDTLGEGGSLERGQAQVPNLDRARGARDEDVVTLEVTVDDGGRAGVQEMQPLEDLPAPALQHLQLHLLEPLQIAARGPTVLSPLPQPALLLLPC